MVVSLHSKLNYMAKIITVDITHRIKVEMADDDDMFEIMAEMDIDFAWPETQAVVVDQEKMYQEIVDVKII